MRDADSRTVLRSFASGTGFAYEHAPRIVLVSVLWFLCSLPIVTVGPATLAGYAAVLSLRWEGVGFDRNHVVTTVRRHGFSAVLLTGLPLVLTAITGLYARSYLLAPERSLLALVVVSGYAAVFVLLVLVPTFIGLARGDDLETAVRTGARWTVTNATGAVTMGMATLVVAIATGLLTIAFPLAFAGFAFAFHLDVVVEPESTGQASDSVYEGSRRAGS